MTKLYIKLDKLFKVDANLAAFRTSEKFLKYLWILEINMSDCQIEFDWLFQQLKGHRISLPDFVFAYRVLKSNLIGYFNRLKNTG